MKIIVLWLFLAVPCILCDKDRQVQSLKVTEYSIDTSLVKPELVYDDTSWANFNDMENFNSGHLRNKLWNHNECNCNCPKQVVYQQDSTQYNILEKQVLLNVRRYVSLFLQWSDLELEGITNEEVLSSDLVLSISAQNLAYLQDFVSSKSKKIDFWKLDEIMSNVIRHKERTLWEQTLKGATSWFNYILMPFQFIFQLNLLQNMQSWQEKIYVLCILCALVLYICKRSFIFSMIALGNNFILTETYFLYKQRVEITMFTSIHPFIPEDGSNNGSQNTSTHILVAPNVDADSSLACEILHHSIKEVLSLTELQEVEFMNRQALRNFKDYPVDCQRENMSWYYYLQDIFFGSQCLSFHREVNKNPLLEVSIVQVLIEVYSNVALFLTKSTGKALRIFALETLAFFPSWMQYILYPLYLLIALVALALIFCLLTGQKIKFSTWFLSAELGGMAKDSVAVGQAAQREIPPPPPQPININFSFGNNTVLRRRSSRTLSINALTSTTEHEVVVEVNEDSSSEPENDTVTNISSTSSKIIKTNKKNRQESKLVKKEQLLEKNAASVARQLSKETEAEDTLLSNETSSDNNVSVLETTDEIEESTIIETIASKEKDPLPKDSVPKSKRLNCFEEAREFLDGLE